MTAHVKPSARWLAAMLAVPAAAVGGGTLASAGGWHSYAVSVIASGASMSHQVGGGTESLSKPDDITVMDGRIFVAFQNGVGSQGEPSTTGNTDSTVVELSASGHLEHQWDVIGKVDGLSADPDHGRLIATVNEDANSSLYTIDPDGGAPVHYAYSEPLPHNGGTDAISIYHGQILISASAPGTTGTVSAPSASFPALYSVNLNGSTHVATVDPLFSDEASAVVANWDSSQHGETVTLGLTDPDSNEVVPRESPRFGGDFVLDSQGDLQQIYTSNPGATHPDLSVLNLSQSINDTAWATDGDSTLYASDTTHDTIDAVRGPFWEGTPLVAVTPCDANGATSSCAPNYLGTLNLYTGQITALPLSGLNLQPVGLVFASGDLDHSDIGLDDSGHQDQGPGDSSR